MTLEEQWQIIDPYRIGYQPGEIMSTDKMPLPDWKPHLPPSSATSRGALAKVVVLSIGAALLSFWVAALLLAA